MKKQRVEMRHFLSNSEGCDHQGLFGRDAFFDLDVDGQQGRSISKFQKGEECIVLTMSSKDVVCLTWYGLDGIRNAIDPVTKKRLAIFCGPKVGREEIMAKSEAFEHPLYINFFRKTGPQKGGLKLYCVSHA